MKFCYNPPALVYFVSIQQCLLQWKVVVEYKNNFLSYYTSFESHEELVFWPLLTGQIQLSVERLFSEQAR